MANLLAKTRKITSILRRSDERLRERIALQCYYSAVS